MQGHLWFFCFLILGLLAAPAVCADADAEREALARIIHELNALEVLIKQAEANGRYSVAHRRSPCAAAFLSANARRLPSLGFAHDRRTTSRVPGRCRRDLQHDAYGHCVDGAGAGVHLGDLGDFGHFSSLAGRAGDGL